MLIKNSKDFYVLDSFVRIKGLVHGFSTRKFGAMKSGSLKKIFALKLFTKVLNVKGEDVVGMNQVHSNNVVWVNRGDQNSIIDKTDGLLTKEPGIFLYATMADCLPIIFYDRKKKFLGIAHAGWRGLLLGIPGVLVDKMVEKGADLKNILVGIGPSIRACCYNISRERANLFIKKFPELVKEILIIKEDKIFLDLQKLAILQLLARGIKRENIDDGNICTTDTSLFYSYRKGDRDCLAAIVGRI